MLVGGRKGHLAMMDMMSMDLIKEFQVCLWSRLPSIFH